MRFAVYHITFMTHGKSQATYGLRQMSRLWAGCSIALSTVHCLVADLGSRVKSMAQIETKADKRSYNKPLTDYNNCFSREL